MRTLADMTPQERKECVGMWCDFPDPDERTNLAIYVGDSLKHHGFCELIHEGKLGTITLPETLTPRPDLPRAWTPDGTPPAGEWEDDYTDENGNTLTTGEDVPGAGPHTHIRRFVGEWEEA